MSLNWPIIIGCAVGISLLLTVLIIPQILHVSLVKRLFDRPNNRKVHNGIVPRLGGFAFLPVIFVTLGLMLIMPASYTEWGSITDTPDFIDSLPDIIVLFAAMMIMFMVGLYDDLLGLRYGVKFLSQILVAILIVEAGGRIIDYTDLFGINQVGVVMGKFITGFLIIYVINALNLIDGIDGLASGICVITLSFYGISLLVEKLYIYSMLSWTGAASMFVFWLFNVFGSKKRHTKIFMGDIGSLSMGLFIAYFVIVLSRQQSVASAWGIKPLILALSPLVIPMLDVIRVFCIRICRGRSPFLPDKNHIHHAMLNAGLKMRQVMCVLVIAQISILVLNLWLSYFMSINTVLIIDVVIYIVGILIINAKNKTIIKDKIR